MLVFDDVFRLHNFAAAAAAVNDRPADEDGILVLRRDQNRLPSDGQGTADGCGGPADRHGARGPLLDAPGHGQVHVDLRIGCLVDSTYVSLEMVRPRKCLAAELEVSSSIVIVCLRIHD